MWRERKKLAEAARLLACGQLIFEQSERKPEEEIDEALAAWGLVRDESSKLQLDDTFALWPECLEIFLIWQSIQTQWRSGMGGATGLDYAGVQAYMALRGIANKKRPELFSALQVMETATLKEWHKK